MKFQVPDGYKFAAVDYYFRNQPLGFPQITDQYKDALKQITLFQEDGVTHFYGCQLDFKDGRDVWLSPVEVDDGENQTYFEVLYLNISPEDALESPDIPVSLLHIDESGSKILTEDAPEYRELAEHLSGTTPRVIIRSCITGMAYYPHSITPDMSEEIIDRHLKLFLEVSGLSEPKDNVTIKNIGVPLAHDQVGGLTVIHSRKYQYQGKDLYSYGILLDNDPWKYYELFTPKPAEEISKEHTPVRVDSGCNIGQIYDEHGCDCREQLHTALSSIQAGGDGAVVHIPAHDGRGFGAATKMETEGFKRGIPVATNRGMLEAVDTITAAEMVLGKKFDIRTYDGAGRILHAIGVKSALLQTDNRLKIEGIAAAGIEVERKATATTGKNGSQHHIEAKHKYEGIYYSS